MAIATDRSGVRASDEDRERMAAEIREHFALGRMDVGELDHRLGSAYAAVTVEELRAKGGFWPLWVGVAGILRLALGARPVRSR